MNNWSIIEENILKENYERYTNKEISEKFLPNRSPDSIMNKARAMGLKKPTNEWSDEEIEILKKNYPTSDIKTLRKLLPGRSEKTIYTIAMRLNLRKASLWNEKEIEFVKENYEILGARGCLRKMKDEIHNEWQTKRLAKELKLSFKGNRTKPWTVEDDKYLKELWDTNAPNKYELAIEKLGRSKNAIKQRIIALNKKK